MTCSSVAGSLLVAITWRPGHGPLIAHSLEVLTDRLTSAMVAVAAVNVLASTGHAPVALTDTGTMITTSFITRHLYAHHSGHSSRGTMLSPIQQNPVLHLPRNVVMWKTTPEVSMCSLFCPGEASVDD